MSEITYAILSGKISDSQKLKPDVLGQIPDILRSSFQSMSTVTGEEQHLKFELQRLDEFIAFTEDIGSALHSALLLASQFRYLSYQKLKLRLDLKISISIGPVELRKEDIRESDGTAIRQAANGLDSMKKNQRLLISSGNEDFNKEFSVSCGFMDILIHDWSDEQAEALFYRLSGMNQVKISEHLGISQPAVNRRLKAAHAEAIERFTARYEELTKPQQ